MAGTDHIEGSGEVNREALAWVERLRTGRMTVVDGDALEAWRQQSSAHAQAFAEAAVMARLVREATVGMIEASGGRLQKQTAPMERRAFIGGMAAVSAALVGYVAINPPLALWPSLGEIASNLKSDYATNVGEQKSVRIADATVELNTQSGLSLLHNQSSPGVELTRGEAMVDTSVSPFIVNAGVGRLTAKQARFNVRLDEDITCVTCVSGSLQLVHPRAILVLSAGKQLVYSPSEVKSPWQVNVNVATAWHRGMLTFHNETLSNVVAEVNRYRSGRIVILRDALAQQRVYASFHLNKIDTIVDQLQRFSNARVYAVGKVVFLS